MRTKVSLENRPRCLGRFQKGEGTLKEKSSSRDQQWSVSPAAIAGVRLSQRVEPSAKRKERRKEW